MRTLKFLVFSIILTQLACGGDTPQEEGKDTKTPNTGPAVLTLDEKLEDRVVPKEIMVSLLSFFDEQVKADIDKTYSESQIKDIKSKIMRHDLTIASVRNYLNELKKKPELASRAEIYLKMMTKNPAYQKLWTDFYGRVFDTVFVDELVKNPPPQVRVALNGIAKSIGANLSYIYETKLNAKEKAILDEELYHLIAKIDFRFWFPEVAALNNIKNSPQSKNTTVQIIDYLRRDKVSGFELISVPYLTVKTGNILKASFKKPGAKPSAVGRFTPGYIVEGDSVYRPYMAPFINKIRGHLLPSGSLPNPKLYSKAAGLTLLGQPVVATMPNFIASQRPTVERFPKYNIPAKDVAPDTIFALRNQLEHGVVWASGLSGSTNIDMHAWKWIKNNERQVLRKDIDGKAAFLGTIMFLVYDGGHSINEPLWAFSIIENHSLTQFGLKLNLTNKKATKDFVPDFEKFKAVYKNTALEERVEDAFKKAFDEVIANFRMHGHKSWDIKNMPTNPEWNKTFGGN